MDRPRRNASSFTIVLLCVFSLLTISILSPSRVRAADGEVSSEGTPGPGITGKQFSIDGYFLNEYRYRATQVSGEHLSDQDIAAELRFDVTMPERNRFEFHFFGTANGDLDGKREQTSFYPLEDVTDTTSSWLFASLYEAHLDVNYLLPYLRQLRIGRQAGTRSEQIFFDGVASDFDVAQKLRMTVYGGVAVHFFEIDSPWGSDMLAGIGADYFPFDATAVNMDYLYTRDNRTDYLGTDRKDHLLSFKVRQRLLPSTKAMIEFNLVNVKSRDMEIRVINSFPKQALELSAAYYIQFQTMGELSNELSQFYDVVGATSPYQYFDINVRKLFGQHFSLDAGYYYRFLLKKQEESEWNRQYTRLFAAFGMEDVLLSGLSFAFNGDYWKTGDNQVSSAGLSAEYEFEVRNKKANVDIGTYFSLYKYDDFSEQGERENVQTYYIKSKIPVTRDVAVEGRYEYENGLENYHALRVGMCYEF